MPKGLRILVYRHAALDGDCTNGGLSSRVTELTVRGPGIPEIFDVTPDAPEVVLTVGHQNSLSLRPTDRPGKWHMFGGNFGWTTDSRFRDAVRHLSLGAHDGPVAIHDRVEG